MSTTEQKTQLPSISMLPGKGLQITSVEDLQRTAKLFLQSGLFGEPQIDTNGNLAPKQIAQACVKILAGTELGLTPFFAMKNMHIVEGKGLTAGYQTVGLLVKRSGRYKYKVKERTDKKCTLEILELENGKWELLDTVTYGEEDAKKEKLFTKTTRDGRPYDTGYQKYPSVMYFSRALTRAANMYCPDIFGGSVYAPADFGVVEAEIESEGGGGSSPERTQMVSEPQKTNEASPAVQAQEDGQGTVEATVIDDDDRPKKEQLAQLFQAGVANEWTGPVLEAWFENFLKERGVDITDTETLFATWTWADFKAAVEHVSTNKPEAK